MKGTEKRGVHWQTEGHLELIARGTAATKGELVNQSHQYLEEPQVPSLRHLGQLNWKGNGNAANGRQMRGSIMCWWASFSSTEYSI